MYAIDRDTLDFYARTNEKLLAGPVRGVILEFPGLGGGSCLGGVDMPGVYDTPHARDCAERGFLLAYAFTGPWGWMNDGSVRTADAVVEAIFGRFALPEGMPMVYTGGSMGGQGALIYTRYAKRKPDACAVNGPACDMFDTYWRHESFPRTVHHAISHYGAPPEEALATISPLSQVDGMPRIPYFIVHCELDEAIPIDRNAEPWVRAMRERGHDVTYVVVPDRGHCDITPEAWEQFRQFVFGHMGR